MTMNILGKEFYGGSFEIKSGAVKIGDPAYSPDTWCLGSSDALNGTWNMKFFRADNSITDWGDRNTALFAFNKQYFIDNFSIDDIEVERFVQGAHKTQFLLDVYEDELGVDSGQAGIFDEKHYIKVKEEDKTTRRRDSWYWSTSDIVLHGLEAGVTPDGMGCVSSSGYGDGIYDYYCYCNKEGDTVAILIVFITEEHKENGYE